MKNIGGIDIQQIKYRGLWSEVRIFNTTLIDTSALDDFLIGVGVFGIIERMFVEISSLIRNAVKRSSFNKYNESLKKK